MAPGLVLLATWTGMAGQMECFPAAQECYWTPKFDVRVVPYAATRSRNHSFEAREEYTQKFTLKGLVRDGAKVNSRKCTLQLDKAHRSSVDPTAQAEHF